MFNSSEEKKSEETNLRLEALRLANAHGKSADEVLARASRFEKFLKYGDSDNPFD